MAPNDQPYDTLGRLLSSGGVFAAAHRFSGALGTSSLLSLIRGAYPELSEPEAVAFSDIVSASLRAGESQSRLPPGDTIPLSDIPVTGVFGGGHDDEIIRYGYATEAVYRSQADGTTRSVIVNEYSDVVLPSARLHDLVGEYIQELANKYQRFYDWLQTNPLSPEALRLLAIQRRY